MATREDRAVERMQREEARRYRDAERAADQQAYDAKAYGEDSLTYKMKYGEEGKLQNVDTNKPSEYTDNQTHYTDDSNQRGEDVFTPTYNIPDATGVSLGGVEILWADDTYTYISTSDILQNYNSESYWSIALTVADNVFTKVVAYDSTEDQWNDTGTNQTVYRLRIITQNGDANAVPTSVYGQYRESIICRNGEPVTVLTKTS